MPSVFTSIGTPNKKSSPKISISFYLLPQSYDIFGVQLLEKLQNIIFFSHLLGMA